MNNINMSDSRSRRNLLYWTGFFPFHSVTNYSSDATKMKLDMKDTFGDGLYISNLHLIPDPLKKNLADSILTEEVKTKTNMASETKTLPNDQERKEVEASDHRIDYYPSLAGITSFFSGVFSFVSGAMFHKRANPPTQYYECFEQNFDEMTPSLQAWQHAKSEDQNKNGWAHNVTASTNGPTNTHSLSMDLNCKINAARCEDKLNQVRLLLTNHHTSQYQPRLRPRRPSKVFVEPKSIDDCFEDAFSPEDFETFPNNTILEYYSPLSYQNPELLLSDAPQINAKYLPVTEHMEISDTLPDIDEDNSVDIYTNNEINVHIVSSCEDKINALKALLDKRQKHKPTTGHNSAITTEPTQKEQKSQPITVPDTNRIIFSAEKKKQNNTIKGDKTFDQLFVEDIVKDINSSDLNNSFGSQDDQCSDSDSPEYLDPTNYFDEVTGRFYSTSATDSEDSFQIVFTDSPRSLRKRNLSDCDSEDSFIVFEDSPDSCYLSNDVFGDELSSQEVAIDSSDFDDSDESDNSDSESDSGCDYHSTCKLSHSLTRTIGDLTDDSLYEVDESKCDEDEVDCAPKFTIEEPVENVTNVIEKNEGVDAIEIKPRGLLIDQKRKLDKKKQPAKNVHFSPHPPKVHVMRVWAFAARQARAGHWERHALDRERFKRRIADVDMAVSWVLKPQHRSRVMFQRFMPWWNAQKRKELAEKKQKEIEEKNAEVNNKISDLSDAEIVTESDVKVESNDKSDAKIVIESDQNIKINEKSDAKIVTEPDVSIKTNDKSDAKIGIESDVNVNNIKNYKFTLHTEINKQRKKIVNGFESNIELREESANISNKIDNGEKNKKLKETHKAPKNNEIELIDDKINALKLGIPGKDIDALTT